MANDQELAGLSEDVREAWRNIDYATPDVRGTCIAPTAALETIFHDHMRLARENAEYLALLRECAPIVQAQNAAEHMMDGFGQRTEQPSDKLAGRIALLPVGG